MKKIMISLKITIDHGRLWMVSKTKQIMDSHKDIAS